ncbi:MAG TPA: diguanylate cyclase [Anaerolineae bacterium]|nr:diguanylate cyclase [Anaerolineae bacterium]
MLIPIILISLAGGLLTLLLTLYLTEKRADEGLDKELEQTKYAIQEEFKQAEYHLIPEITILSTNPSVKEAIVNNDKESLKRITDPMKATFSTDSIKILDKKGEKLIDLGPAMPIHRLIAESGFRLTQVALFTRDNNALWITATVPVRLQNNQVIGTILVANRIDSNFLSEIKKKTGVEVAFEYGNLFIGSSPEAISTALKYCYKEEDFERSAGKGIIYGAPYIVDRIEVKTNGGNRAYVYALISTLDSAKAKKGNTSTILSVSLAMLLVLVIAAYFVGQSISKPLTVMSRRARMIAEGSYKQRINYSGIQEIDDLATSFNIMSEALEENRLKLEEKAYTDSLTGLFNHRYFHDSLSSEINRANRYQHPLSLIAIDIDDFKRINDNFGHKNGDNALKSLAERLRDSIRITDIACRVGGEEFAIILPETTAYQALTVAERLRLDMSSRPIEEIGRITISLGIAAIPDHATDKDSLIEAADIAMYQAKRRGKNLTLIYNGDILHGQDRGEDRFIEEAYYIDTLHALAAAVDAKDQYTHSHSEHVAAFAGLIGHELGLPQAQIEHLRIAGLLHDVGKIGIPDHILNKPGPLTEDEFAEIRLHPIFSERILARTKLEPVLQAILYHHERMDGSGYPYGLKEDEIPLNARVLAVADSFEAMISDRPYRKALSIEKAVRELEQDSGVKLDEAIVNALIRIIERDESVRDIIAKRNNRINPRPA